jgi:organic radical activating enzyme
MNAQFKKTETDGFVTTQLNTQAVEKPSQLRGFVEVHSIWKTIQGEGPYAGMPAVFIRLAGCNLQCPMCDTEYTTNRKLWEVGQLHDHVLNNIITCERLIVITGGEPFRQDIGQLASVFLAGSFRRDLIVQVETNGTIYRDDVPYQHRRFCLVCSPKTENINAKLRPYIHAFKYVVAAGKTCPKTGLPLEVLGQRIGGIGDYKTVAKPSGPAEIYIQPLDEQDLVTNQVHMQEAVYVCTKFGYRLCLQMHKYAGVE